MSGKLFVPITLRALLVGRLPDRNCFADISNDFSRLPFSPLGEYVPSQLATHRDMQPGIHLHWSLPDSLTRGVMNIETDAVDYPPIPNRWLITRLWNTDGGEINAMSFLVESDAISTKRGAGLGNVGSPTIPDASNRGGFHYLGRGHRCGALMPETAYLKDKLTAVLPGNPLYTAFYPDCRNILGFYDDMTDKNGQDIERANVTYCIAGWFGCPDDDPVTTASRGRLAETLEALEWKLTGTDVETAGILESLICHAMLCAIDWNGADARYNLNIPQAELSVAVGNSTNEALAAMLASHIKGQESSVTERLITHLLSGQPQELLCQDGIANSEGALFEARFSSESPVKCYTLKWEGDDAEAALNETRRIVPEPSAPLSALLDAYNHAQEEQAARLLEIQASQESLFDTWFMWKRGYGTDFTNQLKEQVQCICDLKRKAAQFQNLLDRFDVPGAPFGENLQEAAEAEGFAFAQGTAGRFWSPNPPVLLISNTAINTAHGADGQYSEDGLLHVRAALISELKVKGDIFGGKDAILDAEDVARQMPGRLFCPVEAAALAREAMLLSHSFADLYAEKILRDQNKYTPDGHKRLTAAICGLQSIHIAASAKTGDDALLEDNGGISGFNGPLPEKTAVSYHKQPWFPLYMDWKADYYPDANVIQAAPGLEHWRRMGLDMTYKRNAKTGMKLLDAVSVSGRTFLTPYAGQSLSDSLGKLKADIPNADAISVLSQTLPELHEQLMMRSMQAMAMTFAADPPEIRQWLETALEGYAPMFPLFNSLFSPVRAGFLKIRSITLIDAFGQIMEAEPKRCRAAESMRRGTAVSTAAVMLPPRLLQPSRLNFDFRDEGNAGSLCGWILPNFFDNNITVFSSGGSCVGTLQLVKDGKKDTLQFKLSPERGGKAVSIESVGMDKDLEGFLSGIARGGVTAFSALMNSIDSALSATNPKAAAHFNSLSFFLGRPLALVRAALSLETLGKQRRYRKYAETKPPHADVDISKLAVKLRLGFRHRHGDGLFGFFIGADFKAIHFTGHTPVKGNAYILRGREADFVTVTPNTPPQGVVLLMDPMADVHVTCGILPIKSIRMNPARVQAALRELYHVLFVAPVIQDTESLSLPIFPVEGKRWGWCGFGQDGIFEPDVEPQKNVREAVFDGYHSLLREGWLILKHKDDV